MNPHVVARAEAAHRSRLRLVLAALLAVMVVLTLVPATPAQARARSGRYIVTTYSSAGTDHALGRLRGSARQPRHRFRSVFPGFATDLTPDQVATLRADPQVRSVVEDGVVSIDTTQSSPPWGLDRIDQTSNSLDNSYTYGPTGAGVSVYVIDTGIRTTHTQFGGRAVSGYDFVDSDATADDCNGHGTHVAGTIGSQAYGVAKGTKLVALRVLDCDGSGYESDVIAALQWVIDHKSGPAVVNMSLGGDPDLGVDDAVRAAVDAGVEVAVAAGNEDEPACSSSPARATSAITVAASTQTNARASFSNYGSCVDIFAPGQNVQSTYYTSDTATASLSGTSMATPHVAGALARYLQVYPQATAAQTRAALLGDATVDALTGVNGSPNALLRLDPDATGAPLGVAATRSTAQHSITLSWQPPYGFGASAVTGYRVSRSGVDRDGAAFTPATVSASARDFTFVNVDDAAAYTLAVSAINAGGLSVATPAAVGSVLPQAPVIQPSASGPTADRQVTITANWLPASSGSAATSYTVQVRRPGTLSYQTFTSSGPQTSLVLTGLVRKADYQARVRANNAAGSSDWSALAAKVQAR